MGAENNKLLDNDIDDLLKFEQSLTDITILRSKVRRTGKPIKGLTKLHKRIVWMKLLSYANIGNPLIVANQSIDYDQKYYDLLKSAPKRVLANSFGFRILIASVPFLSDEVGKIHLEFATANSGQQDVDQRWKFCVDNTAKKTSVATGSLYISEYFTDDDKAEVQKMVDFIFEEYTETVRKSKWMDDDVRADALNRASKTLKIVGYHDKLRSDDALQFYDKLERWPTEKFFEMALSLTLFTLDREFERLHATNPEPDWTKYSEPHDVNALYSSRDNSIRKCISFIGNYSFHLFSIS